MDRLRHLIQAVAREEALEGFPSIASKQIAYVESSSLSNLQAVQNWIEEEQARVEELGIYKSVSWIKLILNIGDDDLQELSMQVPDLKSYIDRMDLSVTKKVLSDKLKELQTKLESITTKLQAKTVIDSGEKLNIQSSLLLLSDKLLEVFTFDTIAERLESLLRINQISKALESIEFDISQIGIMMPNRLI